MVFVTRVRPVGKERIIGHMSFAISHLLLKKPEVFKWKMTNGK